MNRNVQTSLDSGLTFLLLPAIASGYLLMAFLEPVKDPP
jgi:hypothetical protein